MRKKDNKKGGAFPMSMKSHSSAASRHLIDEDAPSRMCGPASLNKMLQKGGTSSPQNPSSRRERFSLLTSHSVESVEEVYYDDMYDDQTRKDDIHSTKCIDFRRDDRRSSSLSRDAQNTIFIPQFNVQKAKEHRERQQPRVEAYLPSVAEGSNESQLPSPSFSSASEKLKSKRERSFERESSTALDIRDQRIERMMKSMQEIILHQEDNLQTLGEQNRQYREKLGNFQDHIFNLKKEQLNQKNEIQKLNFERESFEAEAMVLKEELRVIRIEFNIAKNSTMTREPAQSLAMNYNTNDFLPESTPREVPAARSYSVSFEHHAEIFGEPFEELDSVEQSSSWERSRQRSIFRLKRGEADSPTTSSTNPTLETMEEARQPSDDGSEETPHSARHSSDEECKETSPSDKHSTSGKCSDIRELQQRATQLRETVAKMKLDSPKESTLLRDSEEEEDERDDIDHDNRKSNRALRNAQGKERMMYWDRHDNRESTL